VALTYRSTSAANGGTATVTTITPTLPTGWAADDIVYFCISIGSNFTSPTFPAGWTTRSDANSDSTGRTILAYRTMVTGDTNPTFSWTTGAGKWAWTGLAIQPAAGQQAVHSGLTGPTVSATATSHTSPAFAAGAASGCSVLMTGYRGGANASTAVNTTPPTNWVEGTTGATSDTSTAAGTTSGTRQVASWYGYRSGQTGTITPGAQTVTATAVANLYHVFAVEAAITVLATPPRVIQAEAVNRSYLW
jgi:hypothetical protein